MKYDKAILVTGCAGFIGSNFINIMCPRYPNYMFIGFDNMTYCANEDNLGKFDNFILVKGDISDYKVVDELFETYKFTDVIHFAAESHVDNSISDPLIFVYTNVIGTCNLLDVAKNKWSDDYSNHRFYHVSTDEVYGALDLNEPSFSEETKYDPHSPYSASKAASDHFVRAYHDTYGMNIVISNCSNNFGPNQFEEKLIPKVIKNIDDNKPIPVYGTGENIRDWLYVGDHVEAIDVIFHHAKPGSTYNIGGNNEMKNIELIEKICDIYDYNWGQELGTSRKLITFVEDRKGHDYRYSINSKKLQDELGWKPSSNPGILLRNTIDHYCAKFAKCS